MLALGLAVVFAFVVTRLIPGDPVALLVDGQGGDPEFARRLRLASGVDLPVWRQFLDYVWGLLHGDLGLSLRYGGTPVTTLIGEAAPVTLVLVVSALGVAIPVGIAAGVVSAYRYGTWWDGLLTVGSVLALSLPPVVLATWVMLTAVAVWGVSSVGGDGGLAALAAPVLVLAIPPVGLIARVTRTQILDVLGQDYVRCARAKGLAELAVLIRHALPNAMVAVWAVVGMLGGAVLTSTAVVETVFDLPGLGRLAIFAVLARDYPLTGAVILIFVGLQALFSVLVDVLIVAIDPRSRHPGIGR